MPRVRSLLSVTALVMSLCAVAAPGSSAPDPGSPGAPGAGDPYYPQMGNGGYDVSHYDLDLAYEPDTGRLDATATISARATQRLSAFNLDLHGLDVRLVMVDGRRAHWSREGDELTVTPAKKLPRNRPFEVAVGYGGVPETIEDPTLGDNGWMRTDDGSVVAGEPYGATTWYPANDHPTDKATYSFDVTVPTGLEVVANGRLAGTTERRDTTTWRYRVVDPMAPYLATVDIGEFDMNQYTAGGIRYLDAVDPDLFAKPIRPVDGKRFAWSQQADSTYKRLAHTFEIPAGASGEAATVSFLVDRDTDDGWDFFAVEAAPSGSEEWTTLPDLGGHTTQGTGNETCSWALKAHPFLAHYLRDPGEDAACEPTGTTGDWNAATGKSYGWEEWSVDLSAYAGGSVDLALTVVSDDWVQNDGVAVDRVTGPGGQGSTSFEDGLDTWTVPGTPEDGVNENDWTSTDTSPEGPGPAIRASLARQPEIVEFLASQFGPYPWRDSGAIIDDVTLGFALETQTRPIYSGGVTDGLIAHELAHQWYGDSVAVGRWQDIWLNEGFATYAGWLWEEHDLDIPVQEQYENTLSSLPPDDPFWEMAIGDPGPEALFAWPVYGRGAMTLQTLRNEIGDQAFFTVLRRWADERSNGHGTTPEFVALCEEVSGRQLDEMFGAWLGAGYPLDDEVVGAETRRADRTVRQERGLRRY